MAIPESYRGIVVFAHGSGSSRFSPRNNFIAQILRLNGFGTLLFDLLTREEDQHFRNRFDIALLSERLKMVTSWLKGQSQIKIASIGYFGASTGAAAAIVAAADLNGEIKAIVSRGGRPDLAGEALDRLQTPTLLVVGSEDLGVVALNRLACDRIQVDRELAIVPGASHLFEEPGTLEEVASLAVEWFGKYLK